MEILLVFLNMIYTDFSSSFEATSIILKMNLSALKKSKPNIHIFYDCSDINGFFLLYITFRTYAKTIYMFTDLFITW